MSDENHRRDAYDRSVAGQSMRLLWSYRKAFVFTLLGAVLAVGIGVVVFSLSLPRHRIATQRFMLEFDGAEEGLYPSGTKFSPHDITSDAVLQKVYASNDLERLLDYEDFASSAFVYETSNALQLLMEEYETKLANLKLSTVDRARIEDEFKTRKDELSSPEYELHLQRSGGATRIPAELEASMLPEILATWAEWATLEKGVLKYNIPSYSREIIRVGQFEHEEYLVAADLLRRDIEDSLERLQELKALPGSHNIGVGDDPLSLAEIEAGLEELLQFKLEPLVRFILQEGLAHDPDTVRIYLETRLFRTVLEREEAQGRLRILEDALTRILDQGASGPSSAAEEQKDSVPRDATTHVSQFNDPFLDRLLNMATRTQDAALRQSITRSLLTEGRASLHLTKQADYYGILLEIFADASRSRKAPTQATVDQIAERFGQLEAEALLALDLISSLYEQISKINLNPPDLLYTPVGSVSVHETRGISSRNLALYSLLMLALVVLLFPLGCLVHYNLSGKRG